MSPDDPRHGTNAGYIAHALGERDYCQPCRDAHRNSRKRAKVRQGRLGNVRVDKTGTVRRIRALLALGHTHDAIAAAAGGPASMSKNANLSRYDHVHADVAARIRVAYNRLSMVVPTHWRARECRARALRLGYLPPLAWDDDTIDDPMVDPKDTSYNSKFNDLHNDLDPVVVERILAGDLPAHTTVAEKREVARLWPGPLSDLARLTGWKVERYHVRGDVA